MLRCSLHVPKTYLLPFGFRVHTFICFVSTCFYNMSAIDQNKCTTRKEDQTREYIIMQDAIL